MKRKISKIVIGLSAACYLFSSVTAYASWSTSGQADNFLSMGAYKTSIEEEYTQPEHVDPSQEVSKIVNVKNTGTVGTFVRVAIEKQIGDVNENNDFVPDETLDPEMILITCDDTVWKEDSDGFYYYLKELKPGETTEKPLFESFTLSQEAGNAYKKKEGRIIVKMESIQAAGNAISMWGKSTKDLGIQYNEAVQESKDTSVTFLGKEKGFDINSNETDLFANFKNLMPGTARTQEIKVTNSSDKEAESSLKAEAVEQEKMSSEQLALVEQMLNKYATITIQNNGSTLYEGPVSGNSSTGTNMLSTPISLGKFNAGAEKDLTVSLAVSPEMDNQYLELLGKVRWVFTGTGEDDTAVSGIVPKTGDINMIPVAVSFATATLLLGCGLTLIRKKDDENA